MLKPLTKSKGTVSLTHQKVRPLPTDQTIELCVSLLINEMDNNFNIFLMKLCQLLYNCNN